MQTNNVYYAEQPDDVIVFARNGKAHVEFPVGVREIETEDGSQWLADSVYSMDVFATDGLEERIKANYEAWLEKAKEAEPQSVSLSDVVEALNVLTDIVLGGM